MVVKEAARAVLISGTPLMSRPIEMWTQVEMLRPGLLGSYEAYGDRFCVDLRTLAAGGGGGGGAAGGWMDPYRGARDLDELRTLLEQNVMLRRTKESVDMALPPKLRHRIEIQVKLPERRHEIISIRSSMAAVSAELSAAPRDSAEAQRLATRRMLLTSELYRATGRAKIAGAIEFLATNILGLPQQQPASDDDDEDGGAAAAAAAAAAASARPARGAARRRGARAGGGAAAAAPAARGRKRRAEAGGDRAWGPGAPSSDEEEEDDLVEEEGEEDGGGGGGGGRQPRARRRAATKPAAGRRAKRGRGGARGTAGRGGEEEEEEAASDGEGGSGGGGAAPVAAGCGKVLVFAHNGEVLDAIERQLLVARRVPFIRIDGKVEGGRRQALVDAFQTDPKLQVALISITAGGVGLTLTAADRVVFAELYWVSSALLQAEDRAHRVGQEFPVNVYYLVAPGTADDEAWASVNSKQAVVSSAMGDNEAHARALRIPISPAAAVSPQASPPRTSNGDDGGGGGGTPRASPPRGVARALQLGGTPAGRAGAAAAARLAAAAAPAPAGPGDDELDEATWAAAEEVLSQHEARLSQEQQRPSQPGSAGGGSAGGATARPRRALPSWAAAPPPRAISAALEAAAAAPLPGPRGLAGAGALVAGMDLDDETLAAAEEVLSQAEARLSQHSSGAAAAPLPSPSPSPSPSRPQRGSQPRGIGGDGGGGGSFTFDAAPPPGGTQGSQPARRSPVLSQKRGVKPRFEIDLTQDD
ncbi:hypothetical protein Rsub_09108 [Raphidocelis subcapitata]|uniref:Helicase C-terminal domain-containing protein n=1 Tax=Raphidocelis subcapitata TaxID=307507 RepID=A0A2V0PEI5_9CHLO|nr:hypothetical protein Rsub_09108 [Raphidocelis subcapitata]|eukprot:GBF96313.1 hypothetical protein Rsub_09108 [Raphidocelis subcapitata]